MLFRRILAGFLVILFVLFSAVTFTVFAASNTFLNPDFYKGPVQERLHEFTVKMVANGLLENDEIIAKYFTETDLRREVGEVFTLSVFGKISEEFIKKIDTLKENPNRPVTVSLKLLRESMFTLAHNLSFELFESIPKCTGGEIPEVDTDGLPTCVPEDVEYNVVAAPFSEQFEKVIFATIPEQVQIDLSSTGSDGQTALANMFYWLGTVRNILYVILVSILVLIALVIYRPFSVVMLYEGLAFSLGGIFGYLVSFFVENVFKMAMQEASDYAMKGEVQDIVLYLVSFVSAEIQKIALIFLAFGALLILIKVYLKKK